MWFCRLHTSRGQLRPDAYRFVEYAEVSVCGCYADCWFFSQLGLITSELIDGDNLNGVVPYPSSATTPPTRPHTGHSGKSADPPHCPVWRDARKIEYARFSSFLFCLGVFCWFHEHYRSFKRWYVEPGGVMTEGWDEIWSIFSRYEGGRRSRNPPLGLPLTPVSILTFLALLGWNGYSFSSSR